MLFADNKLADTGGTTADELERLDDVNGSGIFDMPGTETVHPDMGVFADHPSLPGYIARHPPFQVQDEIQDGGRPSMEVPGGGVAIVQFVDPPYPVPMQYPVLPVAPLYPGATPMSGFGGASYPLGGPRTRLPVGRAFYQLQRPQFIGDAPAEPPQAAGPSLVPMLFGGLFAGAAIAFFVGPTKMKANRSRGRRRR